MVVEFIIIFCFCCFAMFVCVCVVCVFSIDVVVVVVVVVFSFDLLAFGIPQKQLNWCVHHCNCLVCHAAFIPRSIATLLPIQISSWHFIFPFFLSFFCFVLLSTVFVCIMRSAYIRQIVHKQQYFSFLFVFCLSRLVIFWTFIFFVLSSHIRCDEYWFCCLGRNSQTQISGWIISEMHSCGSVQPQYTITWCDMCVCSCVVHSILLAGFWIAKLICMRVTRVLRSVKSIDDSKQK